MWIAWWCPCVDCLVMSLCGLSGGVPVWTVWWCPCVDCLVVSLCGLSGGVPVWTVWWCPCVDCLMSLCHFGMVIVLGIVCNSWCEDEQPWLFIFTCVCVCRPRSLLNGMNQFLESLDITFRRDPNNFRPRINKLNSVKVSAGRCPVITLLCSYTHLSTSSYLIRRRFCICLHRFT